MSRLKFGSKNTNKLIKSDWGAQINDYVISLCWSPKNERVFAAGSAAGPVILFDCKYNNPLCRFDGHRLGTSAIAWRPDGEVLATSGQDGQVRLWHVESGVQIAEMPGGSVWVEHLAWCPNKDLKNSPLLVSTAGKNLRVWDSNGRLVKEYVDYSSTIYDIAWHLPSNRLAVAVYGSVILLDLDSGSTKYFNWKGVSLKLAWSPNGDYLATGDQDSTVHFWHTESGDDLQMWGYHTKVRELSWDSTSRYLATGGGASVVVWDCSGKGPEGSKPLLLEAHKANLSTIAFQNNGFLLASAGHDGRLCLWSINNGGEQPIGLIKYDSPISQLAWASDDHSLVIGTASGQVSIIDVGL